MSDFKLKYSLDLLHYFIFVLLSCGYFIFYGVGQDILALEEITAHRTKAHTSLIEYGINNLGFITNLLNIPVYLGIIALQIFGMLLNFIVLKKILPYSYSFFYLIFPNFYIASFSVVQMAILVPLWSLLLLSDKKITKIFFIFLSFLFHWFTAILIVLYIFSNLKIRTLFLLVSVVPIIFNETIILQMLVFSEIFVGHAIYTEFIGEYLQNLPKLPLILSLIFVSLYFVKFPDKFFDILDGRYGVIIKSTIAILMFSYLLYAIGISSSFALRTVNITLIPILFLIMNLLKQRKYFLTSLSMYFVLSLNLTLKTLT